MKISIVLVLVSCILLGGCADQISQQRQLTQPYNESFDEWIDQDFKPVEPLTSYTAKDSNWTTTNKVMFASAIGGQVADVVSTNDALGRGCVEGNPLYGEDPNFGTMLLLKGAVLGASYWYTEYYLDGRGDEAQQSARNWLYGIQAVAGFGLGAYNSSVDCE